MLISYGDIIFLKLNDHIILRKWIEEQPFMYHQFIKEATIGNPSCQFMPLHLKCTGVRQPCFL